MPGDHSSAAGGELALLPGARDDARPPHRLVFDAARVWSFSFLLAAASGALLAGGPAARLHALRHLAPSPIIVAVLVVLSAGALLVPVSFHHRTHTYLFSLTEIPLLLGLVFVAPWQLVLSRLMGELLVLTIVRRQAPIKVAFNVSVAMFSAALAATAYQQLLGAHLPVDPVGWGAAIEALALGALAAQVSVSIVVRLYGQGGQANHFDLVAYALLLLASIGLAFVVLDAAWYNAWAVLPLALVGGLIVFVHRGYLRLNQRFGALEQLYDFSRSLGGPQLEPTETAWAVLDRVRVVMRAKRAAMILIDAESVARRLVLDGVNRLPLERVVLDDSSFVTRVINKGGSGDRLPPPAGEELGFDSVAGGYRDGIVVPLVSADRVLGALLAVDRQEELDRFDDDDIRLFEALALHASSTIERASLVEELSLEAESKSYQATHDSLTGLPNRTLFLEHVSAALAETGRAAVALLDLDRFKDVNDALGHTKGDRLLCEVAECLVQAAYGRATVARIGGDEFALVVPNIIGPAEAIGIVQDLQAALSKPISVDGIVLAVRASAGIALGPENGDNVSLLLQRADLAMYMAKERHSGIELYSSSQEQNMERKLVLGGQLAKALRQGGELYLMFQPITSLTTGEVTRCEALARWNHPELGQIPVDEFIPIASQMGLIGEITEWVLNEGFAEAARWRRDGTPIGVAVNLSGRDLTDPFLVSRVARQLEINALPASSVTLEVTETEVMADIGEASKVLARLAELGVRIAVDDFGTGYSSLAYLHKLPLNELKIDRSFITNLAEDENNAIIVRSSIAMAHSLGLSVVAEGAEEAITCALLAEAKCDSVQGYYVSRPLTAAALRLWLEGKPRLELSAEVTPALRVVPDWQAKERALGRVSS